jgi:serine/threonine protein kinase
LNPGTIPADEALEIARQIAEAPEDPHEHGIIHRDLKPANIKVTPDGKVKVLDFGLAKALVTESATGSASSEISRSPTMSRHMTEVGMILGTTAYMSPEQARGRAVDKRAAIWAFGVVLLEMLIGRRAFRGEDATETMAAVIKDPAPLDAVLRARRHRTPRDGRTALAGLLGGRKFSEWRQDDRELYYLSLAGEMMASAVTVRGSRLELGAPVMLFSATRRRRSRCC